MLSWRIKRSLYSEKKKKHVPASDSESLNKTKAGNRVLMVYHWFIRVPLRLVTLPPPHHLHHCYYRDLVPHPIGSVPPHHATPHYYTTHLLPILYRSHTTHTATHHRTLQPPATTHTYCTHLPPRTRTRVFLPSHTTFTFTPPHCCPSALHTTYCDTHLIAVHTRLPGSVYEHLPTVRLP